MKKNKQEKKSGADAFEKYYSDLFSERWEELKKSFFQESCYFELKLDACEPYYLDSASVLASLCLPLENSSEILDLCAAPGGKTLVLASRMNEDAHLTSNERSGERRNRLLSVVSENLPVEVAKRVSVTGIDGTLACKKFDKKFDSILLDAPCSSERHVISSPKYLEQWTKSRIKNLSFTQWALLSSSYLILNEGGYLVYSTCAISRDENDGVVSNLFKKYDDAKKIEVDFDKIYATVPNFLKIPRLEIEKTEFGYQILPDRNEGAGPIFFALIQKDK